MANVVGAMVGTVLVIALFAAVGAGGYFGVKGVLDLFGALEPQVATITAIASVVALWCSAILAGGFKWMGRKEKEMQIRAEKADLYERLVLLWGAKLSPQGMDDAGEAELRKLVRLLTLRGSPKVIKAYGVLQALERTAGLHSPETPSQFAKVLLEMRKDLGQGGLDLNESDLVHAMNAEVLRHNSASTAPPVGKPQVSLSQGI